MEDYNNPKEKLDTWDQVYENVAFGNPVLTADEGDHALITGLKGEIDVFLYDPDTRTVGYIELKEDTKSGSKTQLAKAAKHFNDLGFPFMGARCNGEDFEILERKAKDYYGFRRVGDDIGSVYDFNWQRNDLKIEPSWDSFSGDESLPSRTREGFDLYREVMSLGKVDVEVPGVGYANGYGTNYGIFSELLVSDGKTVVFSNREDAQVLAEKSLDTNPEDIHAFKLDGHTDSILDLRSRSDITGVVEESKGIDLESVDFHNPRDGEIARLGRVLVEEFVDPLGF